MELSAKFETVIDRYQFMNIPYGGADAKKKFLELWADVVVTEKRRQMNHDLKQNSTRLHFAQAQCLWRLIVGGCVCRLALSFKLR